MARKVKDVYQRIEEKKQEIATQEAMLKRLNDELQVLNSEKDDLEMHQIFDAVRHKGLDIKDVLTMINK